MPRPGTTNRAALSNQGRPDSLVSRSACYGRTLILVVSTCGMTIADERDTTSSAVVSRLYPPGLVRPRLLYVTIPFSPVTSVVVPRSSAGAPLLFTAESVTRTPPTG